MNNTPSDVKRVAVVATGVIGASWAAYFLARGLDVEATDPSPGAEARLRDAVAQHWPTMVRFGLADGASPERLRSGVAATKLAWWRSEVAQSFAGQPHHPVMQALMPHAAAYGIEERQLQQVIEGCQMDLDQTRYLDFQALRRYCHLVAGVVGEGAARIFGQTDAQTTEYAHKLGLALQLTNIIRDVGEDALRGRIYLPVNELQQFDVKAHEILNRVHSERFVALMKFQAGRALEAYDEALALLPAADRRTQKPGLMMASIYRTLLEEIARDDFKVLDQRVSLTPVRKLWLAWRVQALGKL